MTGNGQSLGFSEPAGQSIDMALNNESGAEVARKQERHRNWEERRGREKVGRRRRKTKTGPFRMTTEVHTRKKTPPKAAYHIKIPCSSTKRQAGFWIRHDLSGVPPCTRGYCSQVQARLSHSKWGSNGHTMRPLKGRPSPSIRRETDSLSALRTCQMAHTAARVRQRFSKGYSLS